MNLTIADARKLRAAPSVLETLALIEQLGGHWVDRSEHADTAQLWIYDFPSLRQVQVAVPLNKKKLSLYLRGGVSAGDTFEKAVLATGAIVQKPPKSGGRHTALNRWKGLSPENGRVILVDAQAADVEGLLKTYLARGGARFPGATAEMPNPTATDSNEDGADDSLVAGRAITPEMLRRRLDRNNAIGRAGERVAYAEEIARLSMLGCPDPATHVSIEADSNVAAGYDIHSSWNGETRCIEVKSSTGVDNDFFITANERAVLTKLGGRAWLYRVLVDSDGGGEVVLRLQDPMSKIPAAVMQPVAWRVDAQELDL